VCVVVGFLYVLNDMFLSSLEMVMSKEKWGTRWRSG
jgi:hypothetical protein